MNREDTGLQFLADEGILPRVTHTPRGGRDCFGITTDGQRFDRVFTINVQTPRGALMQVRCVRLRLLRSVAWLLIGAFCSMAPMESILTARAWAGDSSSSQIYKSSRKGTIKKKGRRSNRRRPQRRRAKRRSAAVYPQHNGGAYVDGRLAVQAQSALLLDGLNGSVLYEKSPDVQRPIASLTKLMTALVFLEDRPDLTALETVTANDIHESGRSRFSVGEAVSRYDLLHSSLVSSDNVATKSIARSSGLPLEEFVRRMNRRAQAMNLRQTHFVEVTGLDPRNVSTAQECARLLDDALRNPTIAGISRTKEYVFSSDRRRHHLLSTNRLLRKGQWQIIGGKTGFINEAGYCFATSVAVNGGREMTGVILGAGSNGRRFTEMQKMLEWGLRKIGD